MKIPYNSSNSFVRNIFLLKDECPFDLYTVTFAYICKKNIVFVLFYQLPVNVYN